MLCNWQHTDRGENDISELFGDIFNVFDDILTLIGYILILFRDIFNWESDF
jgi:hypothetical protein